MQVMNLALGHVRGGLFDGIAHVVAFDEDYRMTRFAAPDGKGDDALLWPLLQRKMPGKVLQAALIRRAHLELRRVAASRHAPLYHAPGVPGQDRSRPALRDIASKALSVA